MLPKAEIGQRLKDLRLLGNYSQKEVAKALEVGVSAVSMWETGERIPNDVLKIRISNFYHVSVEEIFFADLAHDL